MNRPPLIVSWISALIVVGIVVYGWHTGRPLTADVIVVLGAFWSWAVRTTLWSHQQLEAHEQAVARIAAATGAPEAEVRRLYDVSGDLEQVHGELQRKALPPPKERNRP